MTRAEDIDAAIERAKDGRGTEAYYREAIGDRRLLAEEVVRLREVGTRRKVKATCPYCGRRVTLTTLGKLWSHKNPSGTRCVRSGERPN